MLLAMVVGTAHAIAWADVTAFLARHIPGLIHRSADAAKATVDVAADVGTMVVDSVVNHTRNKATAS